MSIDIINNNAVLNDMRVRIATHAGVFHADDVLAIALASYLYGHVVVDRVFNIDVEHEKRVETYDYIIDVGKEYDGEMFFDHHQRCEKYDEDDVLPCGVSLFARAVLNEDLITDKIRNTDNLYKSLYERVFRPVCVQDNGQCDLIENYPNVLFGWVHYMNPVWNSNESPNEAFKKTVLTALTILESIISKIQAEEDAKELVESAPTLNDDAIVILPKYAPWQEVLVYRDEACFVIFPSNRGGYMLNAVPPSKREMFSQRIPIIWENMPEGCTFVHKAAFCASFDTEEHAIAAARMLLPLRDTQN